MGKKFKNSLFISFQTKDLFLMLISSNKDKTSVLQLLFNDNIKHSENFLQSLQKLLNESQIQLNAINAIYLVTTPGSFMSMRLAQAFVISMKVINKQTNIFLTSSFLLSYYFFMKQIGDKDETWKSVDLLISRTKRKFYTLSVSNESRKQEKWYISEPTLGDFQMKFKKKYWVCNFKIGKSKNDYLFHNCNKDLIVSLIKLYCNLTNLEIIKNIMEGKKIRQTDIETLYLSKSMFIEMKKPTDYPNLDMFMEII